MPWASSHEAWLYDSCYIQLSFYATPASRLQSMAGEKYNRIDWSDFKFMTVNFK